MKQKLTNVNTSKYGNRFSTNSIVFLWCAATAFLLLLLCSRSSFLYPCNDWNDANSYFTMGKGMMNGQVIYRDLYDQKGPYLYLLYGLAYLISQDSFQGVFLMEIIAVGAFLFSCHKILCLYVNCKTSCLLLPILGTSILSSKSFYWGGAAEEFCLPLLGFSLFFSIRHFKEHADQAPNIKMILINGIMAGIIMQVKYTLLGFYFAWMAMMAFAFLLHKDFKGFLKGCITFLGSMLLTLLPWLIYFGINGALDDWYQCYVYNNVFLYSNLQKEAISIFTRIYDLTKILYWLILDNFSYFLFIIIGMFYVLFSHTIHWFEKSISVIRTSFSRNLLWRIKFTILFHPSYCIYCIRFYCNRQIHRTYFSKEIIDQFHSCLYDNISSNQYVIFTPCFHEYPFYGAGKRESLFISAERYCLI